MDRIRRSFRESFRWKTTRDQLGRDLPREQSPANSAQPSGSGAPGMNADDKAELWQPDEAAVRSGTCSFNVKVIFSFCGDYYFLNILSTFFAKIIN